MKIVITAILVCCVATIHGAVYQNIYDQPLDFKCPSHQFISYFWSHHNSRHEDRIFQLKCSPVVADFDEYTESCFWSQYVNKYDEEFTYKCPTNHYIAGMHSVHSNSKEDRRFKFWCCSIPKHHQSECAFSGWQNNYDNDVTYTVPAGNVLKGMTSMHNSRKEDRRFSFEVCKLEALS